MNALFTPHKLAVGAAWLFLSVAGCHNQPKDNPPPTQGTATAATANLEARSGSGVSGTATFDQSGNKVKIVVEISGATPGQHGLHVHQKGDCSAPDAASAGDHFNPAGGQHGGPDKPMHHAGDFGNITIGDDGKGKLEIETDQLTISSGQSAVIGRALVLHEKPDDMETQPSGNSGKRIGCGVITARASEAAPAAPASPAAP